MSAELASKLLATVSSPYDVDYIEAMYLETSVWQQLVLTPYMLGYSWLVKAPIPSQPKCNPQPSPC